MSSPLDLAYESFSKDLINRYFFSGLDNRDKSTHEELDAAIKSFISKMASNAFLKKCEIDDMRKISFVQYWNFLVENPESESHEKRFALEDISEAIMMYSLVHKVSFEMLVNKKYSYEDLMNFIASGKLNEDVPFTKICYETGEKIVIKIDKWGLSLFKRKPDGALINLSEPDQDKVHHATVEFKSGNLLVADMIRVDEIIDLVQKQHSLNMVDSFDSSIETSKNLAKQNMIHVYSGNNCPSLYSKNDGFLIGTYYGDQDEISNTGDYKEEDVTVCTDLWWSTVIDESALLEIMTKKLGPEKAKIKLDDYLDSEKNFYKRYSIEPGVYNLYFHGDYTRIADKLETSDVNFGELKPHLIVSKESLNFELKNENKLKLR